MKIFVEVPVYICIEYLGTFPCRLQSKHATSVWLNKECCIDGTSMHYKALEEWTAADRSSPAQLSRLLP